MSAHQTPDNRTPNGASDLLDDGGADNAGTDLESLLPDAEAAADEAAAPIPSEENDEEYLDVDEQQDEEEEDEDAALLKEARPSLATVSAIVDSIVKQKQSHPEDANNVSELASREINKYYHHEAHKTHEEKEINENVNAALVPREGKRSSFAIDDIHGEATANSPAKAPYQDETYGEQPPIFLWDGQTAPKPSPTAQAPAPIPPANNFVWGGELAGHVSRPSPPGENVSNVHPLLERSIITSVPPTSHPATMSTPSETGVLLSLSHPPPGELSEKPNPPGENASRPLLERSKEELIAARRKREDAEDDSDDEEMDEVALELGMTPYTHPQYFRRKKYNTPLLRNRYCQYCMIITGLVILSLSVAALVTKGFETVRRRHDQVHPMRQEDGTVSSSSAGDGGEEENLDWWLTNGSGMSVQEFESLAYQIEDSYLPIWFDRKTGWEGQTYQEAMEFCKRHDNFMPCPYDVYCPGNTGKLIEGIMDDGISWAPIRDETNGWVQIGAGAKECDVFLGGNENAAYQNWNEDETNTRHVMCCLETSLSEDIFDAGDVAEDTAFSPNLDLPDAPTENHGENSQLNIDHWYVEEITKKYNPRWFDRESKWTGKTYQDAVSFCYSSDKQVPCPYSVYCPKGPTGNLIFDLGFDEGEQWAATGDRNNQFVQVGKEDQCNRVTASNPEGYGRNNGEGDVMSHLMCCDDVIIEVTTAGGEQSNAQEAPVATDEAVATTATGDQSQTSSDSSTISTTPHHLTLTELEHAVKNKYIPFWFGFKDGWSGGTYDDAVDFCANLDPGRGDNFHLCPIMVYCPNGPNTDKPLFLQREAFEGEQWAPTSLAHNAWIQIGQLYPENPRTCTMYNENNQQDPDWGLDGSEPGLKQHIMCCKGGDSKGYDWQDDAASSTESETALESVAPAESETSNESETTTEPDEFEPAIPAESDTANEPDTTGESAADFESNINIDESTDSSDDEAQGSIQGMPSEASIQGMPSSVTSSGSTHSGAGNSSPHGGTTTQEQGVVVHLQPVWYDHSQGWNGGSHQDAEDFCESKGGDNPMTLCPYMAYCPQGPSALALGGLDMSFATEEQYAPYQGEDEHWVLIGRFNNARTTTCLDYTQLFGDTPSWATDSSRKELKQHVLCCKSGEAGVSSVVAADVLQSTAAPITTVAPVISSAEDESQPFAENESQSIVDISAGAWYGISDGWRGGSHTDAIRFCNEELDDDGVPLQLCPYDAYCPGGPSKPTVPNTYLGINEELEQWSPTLSKGNHWVMVGSRNGNDSTTCLDTWQLDGDDNPSWGLDASNSNQKHHVMCCPLTR